MNHNQTQTPQHLTFSLFYEQIQSAHEIYKEYCFFQDFIGRCSDRLLQQDGLCNLPYETLSEQTHLLCLAYDLYQKWSDCNVAYNDTLNCVIDEIEQRIANGTLLIHDTLIPHVELVIEDGMITACYTNKSPVTIMITELNKEYVSSEERDSIYSTLESNPELSESNYTITIPGYDDQDEEGE